MSVASKVAKNIKRRRQELGLSQHEAAELLACSLRTLQYYEDIKNPHNFSIDTLERIAKIFKIEFLDLFHGVGHGKSSDRDFIISVLNDAIKDIKNR